MKKIFTLIAVALAAVTTASAKYQLSLADLPNGWGSSYDAATQTITYEADAWGGRGWGLIGWTAAEGVTSSVDFSAYDYVVVRIEESALKANLVVEYSDGVTLTDDGSWLKSIEPVGSSAGDPGTTILAVKLNHDQKYITQIYVQNSTWQAEAPNNPAGTIKLVDAFLGTEAEYEEAKTAEGDVEKKQEVNLAGFGDSFADGILTLAGGDYGWYSSGWIGSTGYPALYKTLVFEIESCSAPAKVTVQVGEGNDSNGDIIRNNYEVFLDATDQPKTYAFAFPEGITEFSQFAFQNNNTGTNTQGESYVLPEDVKIKIKSIFFTSRPASDFQEDVTLGEAVTIWEGSQNVGVDWAWGDGLNIGADKFAGAADGSQLTVYYTQGTADSYGNLQFYALTEGGATVLTSNQADLNQWNCVVTQGTDYAFTLNAADAANLAAVGLHIGGFNVTLTKVTLANPVNSSVPTLTAAPVATGAVYNLAGQKVDKDYRGVVIRDGRKYLQK